jgi:2-hydroxychromene-2-carboxylate isomerase
LNGGFGKRDLCRREETNVTDAIWFHFDPRCPWAWQAAKWIREVEAVRDIEVRWGLFSLLLVNEHREELEPAVRDQMHLPLRTLELTRREAGNDGIARAYAAIGERLHDRVPRPEVSRELVRDALADAGIDPDLVDRAMADPSTEQALAAEHQTVVDAVGAFGVPTIVLPSGRGIFGPVTAVAPTGGDAGELWDHVRWLAERAEFFELKRVRDRKPGQAA